MEARQKIRELQKRVEEFEMKSEEDRSRIIVQSVIPNNVFVMRSECSAESILGSTFCSNCGSTLQVNHVTQEAVKRDTERAMQ